MNNYWALCWACDEEIKNKDSARYIKCSEGNYNFCEGCFNVFIVTNTKYFRPDRSRKEEISASLNQAVSILHEKLMETADAILDIPSLNERPSQIQHNGSFYECYACEEILRSQCKKCTKEWKIKRRQ